MKIRKKIREIVGSFLEEQGFAFFDDKSAYPQTGQCSYVRKYGEIEQSIWIGGSPYERSITLQLQTDVWGTPRAKAAKIVPELLQIRERGNRQIANCMPGNLTPTQLYQFIIPFQKKSEEAFAKSKYSTYNGDNWRYETEEELERALWEIREIIEQYGLAWLDNNSTQKEIIPTPYMGEKLYQSYQQLSENFASQHNFDTSDLSRENIAKSLTLVQNRIYALKNLPYLEVQDDMIEMAAFLGEQMRRIFDGEWTQRAGLANVYVSKLNGHHIRNYSPLIDVVEAWEHQDTDVLEGGYWLTVDGKLPMTEAQMIEYNKKCDINSALREEKSWW